MVPLRILHVAQDDAGHEDGAGDGGGRVVSDVALLAGLRAGDQAAFDAIFRAHYAPLVRVVEAMLHRRDVAEEVVQEVMLELWRRRDTLVVEESLRAYLFRAARNRALNSLRHDAIAKRAEPVVAEDTVAPTGAHAQLVEEEIEVALRTAMNDLPDRCREVFELSRVHGLRYAEIATTLGISVKTVEAQMGKALRILRERMAPWLPGGSR